MAAIPMRFKRVTAPLDDLARARLCESSGSDYSPENSPELADLVDSFLEREGGSGGGGDEGEWRDAEEISRMEKSSCLDGETRETLEGLLLGAGVLSDGDRVRRWIRAEVEAAWPSVGAVSVGFKRKLMRLLRERGMDAGLCKSRWEKTSTYPAGEHEYIDVVVDGGGRYIIEVDLAGEFDIARPTAGYLGLLELFPPAFVGGADTLKQVVRLMCAAAKESIKRQGMHLPPWRRNGYMMGKWFGSYRRTTSEYPARKASDCGGINSGRGSVGFVVGIGGWLSGKNCRGDLGRNEGLRVGNLAVALKGSMQL